MAKAFNKEQLKDMVDMLRAARQDIKLRRRGGICHALWREVPVGRRNRRELIVYLIAWISNMLGSHAYLEGWLGERHHIGHEVPVATCWQHRLAWIDWMVAELEREIQALDAAAKHAPDERFRIAA